MTITKENLLKLSDIIQIQLFDSETDKILNQINNIIDYVSRIDGYLAEDVELQFMIDDHNRIRDDIPMDSIPLKDALKNATRKNENFFKVPKVYYK